MENESRVFEVAEVRTLEVITADIRSSLRTITEIALMGAINIGKCLIEAKELVGHGEWLPYLEKNVGFSERSAQNYMRVYKEYGENINPQLAADLGFANALRLLVLPDDDQKEVREKIVAGEIAAEDVTAEIEELRSRARELEEENSALQLRLEDLDDYTPSDEEIAELKKRVEKAEKEVVAANKRTSEAGNQMHELSLKLKDAKAKADTAAQKKIDKAVEDARKELEEKTASASAGEIEKLKANLEAAESRAAAAEKSAAIASDPNKVKVSLLWTDIQVKANEVFSIINGLTDEESAQKMRAGTKALFSALLEKADA